ncbi:MAG TPA: 7,8-didemethyl-8-hydroxy-5-deazariboflavin synthase CofG, partial [Rhizomicrobium sp.]|nr:7,8-didemethyl-8-hydroxy-5-deazariboflavin synthase CofG [Rhizomicrobium sp.]
MAAENDCLKREILATPLEALTSEAANLRNRGHGDRQTWSRKVFIPLTQLCRDVCQYCTFAHPPRPGEHPFLEPEEVLRIARAGAASGCTEALFTLGEKPELRYRVSADALDRLGHESTIGYLAEVCDLVVRETGLLPHVNPGTLNAEELARLRGVSVSQGLMLESIALRLCERGGPHFGSPDKHPAVRLETIRLAGALKIPFTSGLLIGLGETRAERIDALLALAELHRTYGHIQEIIIQNFRAKPGTRMEDFSEPPLEELLWTIAAARIVLGPAMNIQAPPNLSPGAGKALIGAGINDWGGVSPVTIDHVNPEAPWPHISDLHKETEDAGKTLVARLPLYPQFVQNAQHWVDPRLLPALRKSSDACGFAREDDWIAGTKTSAQFHSSARRGRLDRRIADLILRAKSGDVLSESEIVALFEVRGDEFAAVCDAANALRESVCGDQVSYVVTRNINYTNVCSYRCGFCAFSKGASSNDLRGRAYDLDLEEVERRVKEAWERGATEICMQGGIHPAYTGGTYIALLRAVRRAAPNIHIHAFSPLEIYQGAASLQLEIADYLRVLQQEGLGTLPGTAAEILDDEIRAIICPGKLTTDEWL